MFASRPYDLVAGTASLLLASDFYLPKTIHIFKFTRPDSFCKLVVATKRQDSICLEYRLEQRQDILSIDIHCSHDLGADISQYLQTVVIRAFSSIIQVNEIAFS